jgi:hypothetical protein
MPERITRDAAFHELALKRYDQAKTAWSDIREDFELDLRYAWPRKGHGQWDPEIESARENADLPALTFNELHPHVLQVVNRARQERPQPKVTAGDKGDPDTADVIEGKLRHIQYASQADVAYDTAVVYQAAGGWGFYDVTLEYIDDGDTFIQEPRIKRVQDPMCEYPDPGAIESDFSDAKWWISRYWMDRDAFKERFKEEPVEFEAGTSEDWSKEEQVCIAKYWTLQINERRKVQLADGTSGFDDEIDFEEADVVNERPTFERTVYCDIIDGEKVLQTTEWAGAWIPKVPVLGAEVVVNGKRQFISIIRYARDPQKLENAYLSKVAEKIGSAMDGHYIGFTGQFKDKKWRSAKPQKYYEAEPLNVSGQPSPLPSWIAVDPQIQAASQAALQMRDSIRAAVGYNDNIIQPSHADLSGVAITKRGEQQELTNYHIMDNLERSQYHCARICLDLEKKLENEPRAMKIMGADRKISTVAVTAKNEDGQVPLVPGMENQKHHRFDIGTYDLSVENGPSYPSKRAEMREEVQVLIETNPQLAPVYLDIFFDLMGYAELAERAKLLLPPAIQQAQQAKAQGIPPQVAQQLAQQTQQIQQLKSLAMQALQKLQTKQVEQQGRLAIEHVKTTGQVMVEGMKQQHQAAAHMSDMNMEAIGKLLEMLHESELTPDPAQMAAGAAGGGNAPAGPAGNTGAIQ